MDYIKQYRSFFDSNILLLYKGKITFNLIMSIVEILENRVDQIENDRLVKRKFYGATTESLQNMVHHMMKGEECGDDLVESNSGTIMVSVRSNYYKIITGNYIKKDKALKLEKKINLINSLNQVQLKELYKRILANTLLSDTGNAGLGLIDIARKTGQKLKFNFSTIDDSLSYFNFEIRIIKEELDIPVSHSLNYS